MYCTDLQCPDFLQWGVHGEYRQGITVCPKCGATLVTERPEPGRVGEAEEPVATELPSLPGPLVTLASAAAVRKGSQSGARKGSHSEAGWSLGE